LERIECSTEKNPIINVNLKVVKIKRSNFAIKGTIEALQTADNTFEVFSKNLNEILRRIKIFFRWKLKFIKTRGINTEKRHFEC
jgi:hypothetical protein